VRPPLDALNKEQGASLISELKQIGFTMPGLKETRAHKAAA